MKLMSVNIISNLVLGEIKSMSNATSSFWRRSLSRLRYLAPVVGKVRLLEDEVQLLTSYSSDTVYRLRYDTMRYEYISPAITRLLGFTPQEMKTLNFRSLILETKIIKDKIEFVESYEKLEQSRQHGDVSRWQADYLVRTKDGRKVWVTDISYPWLDSTGKVIGSVGSLRDITDRIEAEQRTQRELQKLAYTDLTTGLANRSSFFNHLDEELLRIRRSNSHFSILLIDIDGLKNINDGYGYEIGDKILVEMAQLIRSCLRKEDICARVSNGEFGIFLPDTPEEGAYWVGENICLEIAKHKFLEHELMSPLHCTVSVGVASTEGNRLIRSTELYKNADTQLYIAKHTGRNQVAMHENVRVH
jgi:diguanylate cyclase (GGDEF)-like protein/PAS domain S-box-containing protein